MGTAGLLLTILLAQAVDADETTRKLRIAWASQYEWREDAIENVTLPFRARVVVRTGDSGESVRTAEGELTVVGAELVRVHAPRLTKDERATLVAHLDWVVRRFARLAFEERFKDVEIGAGETLPNGTLRVPVGKSALLVRDDRLVGREDPWTTAERTAAVRTDFRVAKLRDGYTIEAEEFQPAGPAASPRWSRALSRADGDGPPMPKRYVHLDVSGDTRTETTIEFREPRVNLEHPVVLDPAARDLLAQAWASRYVLPAGVRIESEFQRKIDARLDQLGWIGTVKGELELVLPDRFGVTLDARIFRNPRWAESVRDTCERQLTDFFAFVDCRPFEEIFAKCGFVLEEERIDGAQVVRVIGHTVWGGFLLEDDRLAGHLDPGENAGDEDAWWRWRLKRAGNDGWLVGRLSRRIERERVDLEINWVKAKGIQIPREFECFVPPANPKAPAPRASGASSGTN